MKLGAPAFGDQVAIARMRELRAEGLTLRAIAAQLTAEVFSSQKGGPWHASSVADILRRAEA